MTNRIRHRREITIETHGITIIRAKGKLLSAFCERCRTNKTVFAPEQFAAIFRLSLSEVCRRIEMDEFHLIGTNRGVGMICGSSFQSNGSIVELEKYNLREEK